MLECQSSSGIYDSPLETSVFHEKNFKSKLLRTLSVKGNDLLFTQSTICKRSNKSTTEVLECKINRAAMVRYCADNQLFSNFSKVNIFSTKTLPFGVSLK